jgi:hypothetical protein
MTSIGSQFLRIQVVASLTLLWILGSVTPASAIATYT